MLSRTTNPLDLMKITWWPLTLGSLHSTLGRLHASSCKGTHGLRTVAQPLHVWVFFIVQLFCVHSPFLPLFFISANKCNRRRNWTVYHPDQFWGGDMASPWIKRGGGESVSEAWWAPSPEYAITIKCVKADCVSCGLKELRCIRVAENQSIGMLVFSDRGGGKALAKVNIKHNSINLKVQ